MKFIRLFMGELRRIIANPIYVAMTVLIALCYYFSGYEEVLTVRHSGWDGVPWADVLYFFTMTQQFGFFTSISVIACAVVTSFSFIEDFECRYSNFIISRCSKDGYIAAKFLAVSFAGGLLLAGGIFAYIMMLRVEFPLIAENSIALSNYMNMIDNAFLAIALQNDNYIMYFATYVLFAFLFGALWSSVGLAMSTVINNKFVAAFTPYILLHLNTLLFHGTKFKVETIFRANYSFGNFESSLIYGIGFFTILIIICGVWFRSGAIRRIKN